MFLNLVRVLKDLLIELSAHPLFISLFRFTLEEAVGVEEPLHWEALSEGNLDPEVPRVKELI